MISSLIGWVIFGLIVGAIARFVVPGPDPMGCLGTVGIGIAGSIAGGWLGSLLFGSIRDGQRVEPAGLVGSLIGAVVVLLIVRQFRGRRAET
jgi:uncharacterized membrane protein YeaQ/YmgE (transglycosylase-associated protein family)